MKYCATCQLDYPDTSRFCKACGNQLGEKILNSAPSRACPSCGAATQSTWKFCKQCAYTLDETTVVTAPSRAAGDATYVLHAPAATQASAEEECWSCGYRNTFGRQTCETCGALLGSYARKIRSKKIAIGIAAAAVILVLATGVAAAGWYALGVKVTVQTDPGDSTIVIDGQEIGVTNQYGSLITPRLRAGDHTLTVIRNGYDEWKQSFAIGFTDVGKTLNVKLNLTKFKLTIVSSPGGSEVLVDETSMGNTNENSGTLETTPLPPGEHTVIVRHDGYRDWKQTVTLKADQKLDVTLNSAPVYNSDFSSAESEVRNALEGWAQATRNHDLDSHMRYYADTLDYYYRITQVPSSRIRDDRNRAFQKFNYLDVQLSNINVQLDSTGQRATVVFDKSFDFRGDNNSFYNGSVQDQLTLTKLGGAWLITGEKELKVYQVNK
ncbi:MAG TPA: PEGA domain-containing protein [Pyrinomonadaceae bacterium]|nr:PEGA domain-containing protein [Pyrinomonadaceae bacterium]